MDSWDFAKFQEHLGASTQWGIVNARPYAGRSQISNEIARLTNGKVINMDSVAEGCKRRLKDPEADEFEGEVPIAEIEKDICAIINGDRAAGSNVGYVFDGFHHKKAQDFVSWAVSAFGAPSFWLPITCNKDTAGIAWRKANENAEEVSEEGQGEIADGGNAFETERNDLAAALTDGGYNMTKYETLQTDKSQETVF